MQRRVSAPKILIGVQVISISVPVTMQDTFMNTGFQSLLDECSTIISPPICYAQMRIPLNPVYIRLLMLKPFDVRGYWVFNGGVLWLDATFKRIGGKAWRELSSSSSCFIGTWDFNWWPQGLRHRHYVQSYSYWICSSSWKPSHLHICCFR